MLWLERQVVAALSADVDPPRRRAVEKYVDGVLRVMPEHLRFGVAGESIVLGSGAWLSTRLGSQRTMLERIEGWERNPIGPIRQYARLLSSLVLFASEELIVEPAVDEPSRS
jgi:hypothetical protein